MASGKMKKKCKNAFLDMKHLKGISKVKRLTFYNKTQRKKEKAVDKI